MGNLNDLRYQPNAYGGSKMQGKTDPHHTRGSFQKNMYCSKYRGLTLKKAYEIPKTNGL